MFSREAAITNFIFLGMIRPEIEHTIYHTQASKQDFSYIMAVNFIGGKNWSTR
jgi:hypothetical protein